MAILAHRFYRRSFVSFRVFFPASTSRTHDARFLRPAFTSFVPPFADGPFRCSSSVDASAASSSSVFSRFIVSPASAIQTRKMSSSSPPAKKARTEEEPKEEDNAAAAGAGADEEMKDANDAAKEKKYDGSDLELKMVNSIRALSADLPTAASSGHPGAPMGCAPLAHLLYHEIMKYSPSSPQWMNRDRFVLSNGHACALQYVMLHLAGYEGTTMDDLRKFRKLGSKTPGHPENFCTDGVEVSTGPLGQGISNAVGLAIAERHFAATYSSALFDHYTYVICGDGCLQEGVSSEASSLAGHLGLGKLIVLYDDNDITIDGPTSLSFTEDVYKRYESYGWHVQKVDDVADGLGALRTAMDNARGESDKPSIIGIKTLIGYGSLKEGSHSVHGAPLKADDLSQLKSKFGLDPAKSFHVEDDVKEAYAKRTKDLESIKSEWDTAFAKYKEDHPDKAAEIQRRFANTLPEGALDALPSYDKGDDGNLATRKHSEKCLNALAPLLPELMGGSADLTPSNLTALKCSGDFQRDTPAGRYLRFGVREHGMAAVCNGLKAYGGVRPFCATFLNFAGYAMGAVRLSALSKFGVIYVMTHDSIGLGEDGPTHQPVEMLECLRSTPNLNVVRPADGNEMSGAYKLALESGGTPTFICGSRSGVKGLERSTIDKAMKGAYVAYGPEEGDDSAELDLILIGTGSEVGPCVAAAAKLSDGEKGLKVRVVSMPCQEAFLSQSSEYQTSILPGNVPTLSVEASAVHGWHRFSHAQIGMNCFGMSGKGSDVFAKFGFSTDSVESRGRELVEFYKEEGKTVPDLSCRPEFDNFQGGEEDEGH
uniref:transketolase n=1 Tax=Odontella aurita TaxID=265563 RepID=A0A7S4MWS1_9STRA|mmetsp:Transcript_37023/g.110871  ORF Transcript_37023/g.110871 Transcript_37023/m.110871 type:complete len:823 (+) Transcript_37023:88-2556(+)